MRRLFFIIITAGFSCSTYAEFRIWEDRKGNSLEAEYIKVIGESVNLRYPRKFNIAGFSDEDQVYIQLQNPPKLMINEVKRTGSQTTAYTKQSSIQVSGDNTTKLYSQVSIERDDRRTYDQSLTLKVYWIGHQTQHSENGGWSKEGRTILLKEVAEEIISPEQLVPNEPLTISGGPVAFKRTLLLDVREVPKKLSGSDYIKVDRSYYYVSRRRVTHDEGLIYLLAVVVDQRNEVLAMAATEKKLMRYADLIMQAGIGDPLQDLNEL